MGIVVGRIKDEEFFPRTFGAELSDDYKYDPEKIFQYYAENFELLYRQFSNSQGGCRDGQEKSETAEIALKRYNDLSFETPKQWRQWLEQNRDRIFFSDFGGYKFFIIPEGYLKNK